MNEGLIQRTVRRILGRKPLTETALAVLSRALINRKGNVVLDVSDKENFSEVIGENIPDASTTVKGKIEIATDVEVQTGSSGLLAVVPSALAAWWTWAKTQAITFAGNLVIGNSSENTLTINAGTVTAPNATAVTANSLTRTGTLDTRYFYSGNLEPLISQLLSRGYFTFRNQEGLVTNTANATGTLSGAGTELNTSATSGNSSLYRVNQSGIVQFARGAGAAHVQWTRPINVHIVIAGSVSTNGSLRVQFGRGYSSTTVGDLTTPGFGLIFAGGNIVAEAHNGTTRVTSGVLGTYTPGATTFTYSIRFRATGGTLTIYLNDAVVGTLAGTPTTNDQSLNNAAAVSIANNSDSAANTARIFQQTFAILVE
jgi:hypothetical protein